MDRMLHLLSRSPQNNPDASCESDDPCEQREKKIPDGYASGYFSEDFVEVPCPSHDHPILMIPKNYRRGFLDDLFQNDEFKWNLFTEKEYEWVFHDTPCTICSSLYEALLKKLKSPTRVFEMIYARPYQFNRRLGEGITVFNPGDRPMRQNVLTNPMLQARINSLLKDSMQAVWIAYPRWIDGEAAVIYHSGETGKNQLYVYRLDDGSTKRVSTNPQANYQYPHGEAAPC